jgi:hypothetical protein
MVFAIANLPAVDSFFCWLLIQARADEAHPVNLTRLPWHAKQLDMKM